MYRIENTGLGPLVVSDLGIVIQPGEAVETETVSPGLRNLRLLGLVKIEGTKCASTAVHEPDIEEPETLTAPADAETVEAAKEPEPPRNEGAPVPGETAQAARPAERVIDTSRRQAGGAIDWINRQTDPAAITTAIQRDRRNTVRMAARRRIEELNNGAPG